MFQTKKDFITCSKLIIKELVRCPTRSDSVYVANNEQASLAFTAAFCFVHAEHNLIKLKLYYPIVLTLNAALPNKYSFL